MINQDQRPEAERACMLFEVSEGKLENVVNALHSMEGVASLDVVEGRPDVIMKIEAFGRHRLAELAVQALAAVETMTENVQVMPAKGVN